MPHRTGPLRGSLPDPGKFVQYVVSRTPIGVIRCRSSLRSARTVLENAIVATVSTAVFTAVSTVVLTGVVYTSEVVQ